MTNLRMVIDLRRMSSQLIQNWPAISIPLITDVLEDLEVLAYHMLYTKPWIGRKYAVAPALRDCEAFALWKSETSREHHLECVDAPR